MKRNKENVKYEQKITLKNGIECMLRTGTEKDGKAALENFKLVHAETDFLLTYPDETTLDEIQEGKFLLEKAESEREVEILALVEGQVVGMAGFEARGSMDKVKHRAELGISIAREFWGLGMGRALLSACIECAKQAGYTQLELEAVAENERAIQMYKQAGFIEYGRNPKGFCSRFSGDQELILMRMELANETSVET